MNFPSPSSADAVVSVTSLSRRFGSKQALDDVTLHVPRDCVFGLVGENGAGKTTLIKHLLGLLKAETGNVQVFGQDPVADPVDVLSRVGYLSEYRDLPAWMRVDELLNYISSGRKLGMRDQFFRQETPRFSAILPCLRHELLITRFKVRVLVGAISCVNW